jgi:hypothetical protein
MKILLYCLMPCLGLSACYMSTQKKSQYTKLALVTKLPFVYEYDDGSLKGGFSNDSVCIIYNGDYIIYELPTHYQKEVDDSIVFDGIIMDYFIYKKGQAYGQLFKTLQATTGKKLPVDSVYKTKIDCEDFNLHRKFSNVPQRLEYDTQHQLQLVRLYPKGAKMLDSLHLYFSKRYASLGHSLARKTDAQYGSTLYKIHLFMEREHDTIPGSAYVNQFKLVSCEMIPLAVTNEAELDAFVERYKKQIRAGGK